MKRLLTRLDKLESTIEQLESRYERQYLNAAALTYNVIKDDLYTERSEIVKKISQQISMGK